MSTLAFLVDQLFSPAPGGMGTYIRNLVPALSRADPSLDIVLFHARFRPQGPVGGPARNGRETQAVRGPGPRPRYPVPVERWMREYWTEELARSIRVLYPGWAIARWPKLPSSLSGRNLLHSPVHAAVPPPGPTQRLVVTVHDVAFLVHPRLFPPLWRLMYRAGLARAVRRADALLTVSRHTAHDLTERAGADRGRVHVTPPAVALPESPIPVDEALSRLRINQPYVLFVGTLEPRKNLPTLVRAYRRLAGRGFPHELVLAGPLGWGASNLLEEVGADSPGRIVLTGALSEQHLDPLYRGASVLAYPSIYEGFGLPVLEAMVRGVPVVAADSSSLPEVTGEAALLVDPRSVDGLAHELERVLSDPSLAARLSEAGRVRAAGYSWDETARRTLDVYRSLL